MAFWVLGLSEQIFKRTLIWLHGKVFAWDAWPSWIEPHGVHFLKLFAKVHFLLQPSPPPQEYCDFCKRSFSPPALPPPKNIAIAYSLFVFVISVSLQNQESKCCPPPFTLEILRLNSHRSFSIPQLHCKAKHKNLTWTNNSFFMAKCKHFIRIIEFRDLPN